MSRRIDIELTSKLSQQEWTWRAAGAKQPKGTLSSSVLYDGAKVGDICRAEADFELDGISITTVTPPQNKVHQPTNLLEIKGSQKEFKPVTSQLVTKSDRRGDRKGSGPRRNRGDGEQANKTGERTRRDRGASRSSEHRGERSEATRDQRQRTSRESRPTFKKLVIGDKHRSAVLNELSPEQRPIAEQVLRGGIPAVRNAIDAENKKALQEGRPEINGPALIAIAEEILPKLKAADWMDKAQGAKDQVDEIQIRELRAVVGGADAVARTDEARLLASELREALERRTNQERQNWVKEIQSCITDGRVVRALRLAARPPDPQAKFPAELQDELKTATEQALQPDTPADRWLILLEAVSVSPVRRSIESIALPAEPSEELLSAAKSAAGRIPALAKQLGVTMPPPPRPVRPPKPAAKTKPSDSPDTTETSKLNESKDQTPAPANHAATDNA